MDWLDDAAKSAKNLQGVVITQLPDCSLWASATKAAWDSQEAAAYFGDIARANRNAMKIVGASSDVDLTIESDEHVILTKDLRSDLVAVFLFDKDAPLGMIRLQAKRLTKAIIENLPSQEVVERSRAERVMEFLLRYAPDPHAVPIRVSLQTGISLDGLTNPSVLTADETVKLETAACAILGVPALRI